MREACRISAGRSSWRAKLWFSPVSPPGRSTVWSVSISRVREPRLPSSATADFPAAPASRSTTKSSTAYPASVIHAGDIVSVDVGAFFNGYHGDNAATFGGGYFPEAQALLDATRESLQEGIRAAKAGNRIGDIGAAVQRYVEVRGYSVVRQFVGHGVGTNLHEDPSVPNFGTPGRGPRLLRA